jgi:hypothetical protein
MMPPRRGWGIFGLGFYKDGAPTTLGNFDVNLRELTQICVFNLFTSPPFENWIRLFNFYKPAYWKLDSFNGSWSKCFGKIFHFR